MSESTQSSLPTNPTQGRLKLGPLDLQLSSWTVAFLSVLVVVGASGFIYDSFLEVPIQSLLKSSEQRAQEREYKRHFDELPLNQQEVFNDERGLLRVGFYESDGCLLIERNGRIEWVLDSGSTPPASDPKPSLSLGSIGPVFRQAKTSQRASSSDCLERHPGEFESENGERSGCWVQVWRRWPDGCAQYQWYNTCEGNWDAAKVWVRCVHRGKPRES